MSEMFQVAAAFYFVFVGWQLTTKAIKLQKMAFNAVFEKTKQILAVLFFSSGCPSASPYLSA